jgi:hypothetical protein
MDLINISFPKNYIWTGVSIAGLGLLTYATNHYRKNTKATTNQTFLKSSEIMAQGSPTLLNGQINYIFWNGDLATTYLIIDLLIQDKLVQPLYIQRYTITKSLEKDNLQILLNKKNNGQQLNKKNIELLKNLNYLKHSQESELKDIEILRLMILKQLPEFKSNFMPTIYIETIEKDLEFTSQFYNNVKQISPIHCQGIELIEQIYRFIKHYDMFKHNNHNYNHSRIMIGISRDYKNYDLLSRLKNNNIIINYNIDYPLITKTNSDIKYMATEFLPNDVNMYFLQNEKIKNNNFK